MSFARTASALTGEIRRGSDSRAGYRRIAL